MKDSAATNQTSLSLPMLIMTSSDLKRVRRELASLDDYLAQQQLRAPGQPMARLPHTSRLLDEAAAANSLNLLDAGNRKQLKTFLDETTASAPILHVSFAADPSSAFLLKIVAWVRQNLHPFALVQVGLQPAIAVGCTVRTTNRYFDMSLGKRLMKQRGVLHDMLVSTAKADDAAPDTQPEAADPSTAVQAADPELAAAAANLGGTA